jgi:hypothetical protein
MSSDNPHKDAHTAFDDAARRAHTASLERLSPRVQAQLAQRRRAALAQERRRPYSVRVWPMLALGSTAALTLAVGLFVMRDRGDAKLPTTSDAMTTVPTSSNDTVAITPAIDPTTTSDTTLAPAVIASADATDATADRDAVVDIDTIEDDLLPADLLAAEFNTADDAMEFDAQDESPDFYLWLGSQDAQADVTESL